MNKELKAFDIDLDSIEISNNLFDNISEAIHQMSLHTMKDRFEVILNNNLIESKEKLTNYRTIFGCRISYQDLDKNISFIVREDTKPTYEQLQQELERLNKQYDLMEQSLDDKQKVIDKAIEYINHAQNYGTMAQVMPHLKLYINGKDLLNILKGE